MKGETQKQKAWHFILLVEVLEIIKTQGIISSYFGSLGWVYIVFYLNAGKCIDVRGEGVAKDVCSVKLPAVTYNEVKKFICQ